MDSIGKRCAGWTPCIWSQNPDCGSDAAGFAENDAESFASGCCNSFRSSFDPSKGHCFRKGEFTPFMHLLPPAATRSILTEMTRAVFLDRDGTLIEDRDYLRRPEEVVVYPGAPAALGRLKKGGFQLFIVTNQSGVGRGYFTLDDVEKVHQRLIVEFAGVHFQKIYVAPEAPDQPSRGRKPSPQFLFDARDEFGVSLANSYVV